MYSFQIPQTTTMEHCVTTTTDFSRKPGLLTSVCLAVDMDNI